MSKVLVAQLDKNQERLLEVQKKMELATVGLKNELQALQEKDKEIREAIKKSMELHNVKKLEGELVDITYVAASTRNAFDSKKFKQDQPEVYEKYTKETQVKANVRITIKNAQ